MCISECAAYFLQSGHSVSTTYDCRMGKGKQLLNNNNNNNGMRQVDIGGCGVGSGL